MYVWNLKFLSKSGNSIFFTIIVLELEPKNSKYQECTLLKCFLLDLLLFYWNIHLNDWRES